MMREFYQTQELPVDCSIRGLFHLQNIYAKEIQSGRAGNGNYSLKPKYKEARLAKMRFSFPTNEPERHHRVR